MEDVERAEAYDGNGDGRELVDQLVKVGVTATVAWDLVAARPAGELQQYLAAYADLRAQGKASGPGWLVKAIRCGWTVTPTTKPPHRPKTAHRPAVADEFVAEVSRLRRLDQAAFDRERERFEALEPAWAELTRRLDRTSMRLTCLMAERRVDGHIAGEVALPTFRTSTSPSRSTAGVQPTADMEAKWWADHEAERAARCREPESPTERRANRHPVKRLLTAARGHLILSGAGFDCRQTSRLDRRTAHRAIIRARRVV